MMNPFEGLSLQLGTTALALSLASTAAQASVNIASAATKNMSCSAGVCSPTAKKAVLNVGDLADMLQAADIKVTTGNGALNIKVTAPFSWASANRLTLDANLNVSIKAAVTVAGPGGLTIVTNDGGSGGDLLFLASGKVEFWDLSSSLIVNGKAHTLANDIVSIAEAVETSPSGSYALANDYDASKDGIYTASPVSTTLKGAFEGLGHTIENLKIAHIHQNCVGFFSTTAAKSVVRDLSLAKASVSAKRRASIGALIGCNGGLVANVSVSGSIHGVSGHRKRGYVGGVVGLNDGGTISNASSAAAVDGGDFSFIGGLVGFNGNGALEGTIMRSHATGAVTGGGQATVGGLVGANGTSTIVQSWATGSVTVGEGFAGGLVGESSIGFGANIVQCFATGSVIGQDALLGGFVGLGQGITQSYATGSVTDLGSGGIRGGFDGEGDSIAQSYSLGAVSGPADGFIGGFIGIVEFSGNSANSYWDTETSGFEQGCGQGSCSGISGLTTEQLQSGLPTGFDPSVWGEDPNINGGFPYLLALPPN
jgi:hypothetical protein